MHDLDVAVTKSSVIAYRMADLVKVYDGEAGRWFGFWRNGNYRHFATGQPLFSAGFTLVRDPASSAKHHTLLGANADSPVDMDQAYDLLNKSYFMKGQTGGHAPLLYVSLASFLVACLDPGMRDGVPFTALGSTASGLGALSFITDSLAMQTSRRILDANLRARVRNHRWDNAESTHVERIWNIVLQESRSRAFHNLVSSMGYDISPSAASVYESSVLQGNSTIPPELYSIPQNVLTDSFRYSRTIKPELSEGPGRALLPSVASDIL